MKKPAFLKSQDGFTLIEIIAVLILLGILAAVAVPKYMNLQDEAREKAAESAIAETQARLSMGYGQYLLNHGEAPADIATLCGTDGVNDADVLPTSGAGAVPMGDDFTVSLATDGTITVTVVQNVTLDTAVTGTWTMP